MDNSPDSTAHADGPGPRGPGSIIGLMFRLYIDNLPRAVAISAIVTIPLVIAGLAAFGPEFMDMVLGSGLEEDPQPLTASVLVSVSAYAMMYMLGLLAVTAALAEAGASALAGRTVSVGRAYNAAVRRLPSILGASILTGVIAGIPLALALLMAQTLSGIANIVLLIMTAALGVYLLVRLVFAPFVALLQQAGPVAALTGSWSLVSGMWLRTFAVLFLITLLLGVVQLVFQLFGALVPGIEAFLVSLVVVPLTVLADLLIYLDLRARRDGYDVEHMKSELDALSGPS